MLVPLPRSWQCRRELKLVLELKEAYVCRSSAAERLEQGRVTGRASIGWEEGSRGQRREHTYIAPLMGCFLRSTGLFLALLLFAALFASNE